MKCRALSYPALSALGVILLGLVAITHGHTAWAEDQLAPCNAAAEYLREFASRNQNAATSDQLFPFNALARDKGAIAFASSSDGFENLDAVEQAIEPLALDAALREYLRNESLEDSEASYWHIRDARPAGNLLSLYKIGGSAHCEYGVILDTTNGLLTPLYPYGGEGLFCDGFGDGFALLEVNRLAFPASIHFAGQDGRFETQVSLLPRSNIPANDEPKPQCSISTEFKRFDAFLDWQVGNRDADVGLRKAVQSLIAANARDLQRGENPKVVFQDLLARNTTGGTTDLFERLILASRGEASDSDLRLTMEEIDSFFSGDDWPLDGEYLPLEIDGIRVILGHGTRHFGWRYREYETMAFWRYEGDHLFWVASVDFLEKASQPEITVSGPAN